MSYLSIAGFGFVVEPMYIIEFTRICGNESILPLKNGIKAKTNNQKRMQEEDAKKEWFAKEPVRCFVALHHSK